MLALWIAATAPRSVPVAVACKMADSCNYEVRSGRLCCKLCTMWHAEA